MATKRSSCIEYIFTDGYCKHEKCFLKKIGIKLGKDMSCMFTFDAPIGNHYICNPISGTKRKIEM